MGRFLVVLLLLAAGVVGLGFYLGWFSISTERDAGGQRDIRLRVDPGRMKEDAERARKKVRDTFRGGPDSEDR